MTSTASKWPENNMTQFGGYLLIDSGIQNLDKFGFIDSLAWFFLNGFVIKTKIFRNKKVLFAKMLCIFSKTVAKFQKINLFLKKIVL